MEVIAPNLPCDEVKINLYLHCRKTDEACGNHDPRNIDIISELTAVETNVCYEGTLHFVVNGHHTPGDDVKATTLPGGDHGTLDGTKWGGVTLEDIVNSSMTGFNDHGGNGYPRPSTAQVVTDFGKNPPDIRTAGFFNLPVCTDLRATRMSMSLGDGDSPYWPCDNAEGYTPRGTNIVCLIRLCLLSRNDD